MSAFLVDRYHIDCLVQAALNVGDGRFSVRHDGERHEWDSDTADALGMMLWNENLASVIARYPECLTDGSGIPGPADFDPAEVGMYTHDLFVPVLPAVAILKAIGCYEYQSCEHGGWMTSLARAFCNALRSCLVHDLPGYNEAAWELTPPSRT